MILCLPKLFHLSTPNRNVISATTPICSPLAVLVLTGWCEVRECQRVHGEHRREDTEGKKEKHEITQRVHRHKVPKVDIK